MRIARFENKSAVGWGFVVDEHIRVVDTDSSRLIDAIGASAEDQNAMATTATTTIPLAECRLLAPLPRPPQFLAIGLNYRDHADEAGLTPPSQPQSFGLLNSAIVGPGDPIVIPSVSHQIDWEVELAIVIGKGGRAIPRERVLDHVAGYVIVNDVSARDLQDLDGQFTRAKSLDTFKPMGPWITTVDTVGAADDLALKLWINDIQKQDGTTADLIYDVAEIVHFLSQHITLEPGAVVATGTPAGVGFSRTPPEFLCPGDLVRMEIEGLGVMSNPVVADPTG